MGAVRIGSPNLLGGGTIHGGVHDPHWPCLREFREALPIVWINHNEDSIR